MRWSKPDSSLVVSIISDFDSMYNKYMYVASESCCVLLLLLSSKKVVRVSTQALSKSSIDYLDLPFFGEFVIRSFIRCFVQTQYFWILFPKHFSPALCYIWGIGNPYALDHYNTSNLEQTGLLIRSIYYR